MATSSFTVEEAKELITTIARQHGHVSEATLASLSPEARLEIETALKTKDAMIGSSVTTLAKNLYSSKARFVFELLQNADDNKYTNAKARGETPAVLFESRPDRIVVQCNEDGFTRENLEAICSIGKSSKTRMHGYIGEKGIGFKSVFMVAYKVHVQSGPFSFSFTHNPGDSGLGMITPVWEETDERLDLGWTRFTLFLHQSGDAVSLKQMHMSIQQQFHDFQEKILLFLNNIKSLSVETVNGSGSRTSHIKYSVNWRQSTHATLERTDSVSGTETNSHFYVIAKEITNLAERENQTYTSSIETNDKRDSAAYSTSKAVLAFPITEQSIPIISPQEVFAFLPVRSVGFNFLIQADFVTDASRQDIIHDSARNTGLVAGIADVFLDAVMEFNDNDKLWHRWMRYLPDKQHNWGPLWKPLVELIAAKIAQIQVLYNRVDEPCCIQDIVRLPNNMQDDDNEPLLGDDRLHPVVSDTYLPQDLNLLTSYGLKEASLDDFYKWLVYDLQEEMSGCMQSVNSTTRWHELLARLLNSMLQKPKHSTALRKLCLLPLTSGRWVSRSETEVYFAQTDGLLVPSIANMDLLDSNITCPERLKFFEHLGVKQAPVTFVREQILKSYVSLNKTTLDNLKASLVFLYKTEHAKSLTEMSYSHLRIVCQDRVPRQVAQTNMYTANNQPYGASKLFGAVDRAPGFKAHFVHNMYFEPDAPPQGDRSHTWLQWFHEMLGVRSHVQVVDSNGLTKAGTYLQVHRPDKFVNALRIDFKHNKVLQPHVVGDLLEMEVLCEDDICRKWSQTVFPTTDLKDRVARFVLPDAASSFPWLYIDSAETSHDGIPPTWKPLMTELGLTRPNDLEFGLKMLHWSCQTYSGTKKIPPSSRSQLFLLYSHIYRCCAELLEPSKVSEALERVGDFFGGNEAIYIPLGDNTYTWARPSECIWNAPKLMRSKQALRRLYEPMFSAGGNLDINVLSSFFTSTLGIGDCTWKILIEELECLKKSSFACKAVSEVYAIYEALDSLVAELNSADKTAIKTAFNENALIFAPTAHNCAAWHTASGCVWSTGETIRGRVSLDGVYGEMKTLFVGIVEVKPVDIHLAVDALVDAGANQSQSSGHIKALKESIWTVNALLPSSPHGPTSDKVIKDYIFPIRHPTEKVQSSSITVEFFLIDREPLLKAFQTKIKLLDFTLAEVAKLRPFIQWAKLEDRYLSRCVKEATSFQGNSRPVARRDRQIRYRAYGLLRIARHFDSPRARSQQSAEALYAVLKKAEVLETEGISSDLVLEKGRTRHTVPGGKNVTLHVSCEDRESPGVGEILKVYLPQNENDQHYMFTTALGEKLFAWLMGEETKNLDITGIRATRDVLAVLSSHINDVLEADGIATIGDIVADTDEEEPVLPEPDAQEVATATLAQVQRPLGGGALSQTRSSTPNTSEEFAINAATDPARNEAYRTLLSNVATTAREFAVKSSTDADVFSMSQLMSSLPTGHNRNYAQVAPHPYPYSQTQKERDHEVGAAGELFVFELLSSLNPSLPRFDGDNWQSTIRSYVTVHPGYTDMKPWRGYETSDIVYNDKEGVLTDHFVNWGKLSRDDWAGRTPQYYIEVKTSTSDCNTPFFVSSSQYDRMHSNTNATGNRDSVYAIFRVYNLGRDDMGFVVYVDPADLRTRGQLNFTTDKWTVQAL